MEMQLKDYRKKINITIKEASFAANVPLRTYIRYESDNEYGSDLKRKQILQILHDKYEITENKGILSISQIKNCVENVLQNYKEKVSFCYLFGSYAKGYAKDDSDVDLCISTTLKGMEFTGLIEELRRSLNKKVDLHRLSDMNDNIALINEIMKEGIKIYG